jgi:hypothetical protein
LADRFRAAKTQRSVTMRFCVAGGGAPSARCARYREDIHGCRSNASAAGRLRDIDLASLSCPPTTCVHDLATRLRCEKCKRAGKRPPATLLQLAPRARNLDNGGNMKISVILLWLSHLRIDEIERWRDVRAKQIVFDPDTELDDGIAVGNQIVNSLKRPFRIADTTLQISGSVGIARLEDSADTFASIVERADKALYRAKNAGRNQAQVLIAPDLSPSIIPAAISAAADMTLVGAMGVPA